MTGFASGLYFGRVTHHRTRPKRHRLAYRIFMMLVDLDELPRLGSALRLFSHNRFGLVSFYDRDHGMGDGESLRTYVERHLTEAGMAPDGGPIKLLCLPRIFGYVFNPISIYFCYRRDGGLRAILYEVSNTFGQRHTYLIPVRGQEAGLITQHCDKQLYVSPFMEMAMHYDFRVMPPAESVSVTVNAGDAGGLLIATCFAGRRAELSDRALLGALAAYPLLTLKVIAGIHWEALLLLLKGLRLTRRPPPPISPMSVILSDDLQG